jgi:uncharacterized protein YaiE (UPF0345 family)
MSWATLTKGSQFSLSGGASITIKVAPESVLTRKYRLKLASAEATLKLDGTRPCVDANAPSQSSQAVWRCGSAQATFEICSGFKFSFQVKTSRHATRRHFEVTEGSTHG